MKESKKTAVMSWSSGKDSSMALDSVLNSDEFHVQELLSTVTEDYERVSMHGVRVSLLDMQADSLGIPIRKVYIPAQCSNKIYEGKMKEVMNYYKNCSIETVIFGDLYLEDIRHYRENQLGSIGMKAFFPLWNSDTVELSRKMIEKGYRSVVTCVDSKLLPGSYAGKEYNHDFLDSLPEGVDPCGENGEFHTFTSGGPIFSNDIKINKGETFLRNERFYYCDIDLM